MTNMTNPAEEARKNLDELRFKISTLQDDASLKSTIDEFTDLTSKVENLDNRISTLRQRKYAFDGMLEKNAEDLLNRWKLNTSRVDAQIRMQSASLMASLRSIETRLNSGGAIPPFAQVQILTREAETFEDHIRSVRSSIEEMYGNLEQEIYAFDTQLTELEYSMEQSEAASFGFLPGESTVRAVKAIWCRNGKEQKGDPEGILFLTDQRLIFEQKEEIATKKVLFVTTERQKVQEKLFEVPAVSVTSVKASKQGVFKNVDMLDLVLESGAFAHEATLHIYQDGENWQKLITQVKNHEIDAIRVIAVDQAAVEKAKAAPTQCPYCGGAITKPILRGMETINCDYCGKVIRL